MELVTEEEPLQANELAEEISQETGTPLRKRQRQNLQDLSNTKPLTPIRASGRIRIKMTAAAEQKPPEPTAKIIKVVLNNNVNKCQRRRAKKLKTDLVSELAIDVKRPSSVLVDTSIRALLTNVAFSQLSPENQKILIESLPSVDRPSVSSKENHGVDLNPSSINNEFFNRACIEWRDRLSNGEFTNEHQTKLRAEHEREKSKIDPWKARNFEGIWGLKTNGHASDNVGTMMEKSAMEVKSRVQQGDFEIPEGFISEIWKREDNLEDEMEIAKMDTSEENWDDGEMHSPSPSPSQILSVSTSVPTPPALVTSSQLEAVDSPEEEPLSSEASGSRSSETNFDQPVIAEATSSADVSPILIKKSPELDYSTEDEYTEEIARHVELSNDGVPTRWFHPQEHDYLKNETDPEPSGMDEQFEMIENDIEECPVEPATTFHKNIPTSKAMTTVGNCRINNYDTELPQEIFHQPENVPISFQTSSASVLVNNFMQHQDSSPVVVRQVIEPTATRYNTTVIMQEEQNEASNYHSDSYMIDEAEIEDTRPYRAEEIHMNVAKNVKLLAFPSNVKYNEKYIIEESPQHHIQHPQQHTHQAQPTFRTNGTTNMPQSYFVGGTNFAYISKMGNKVETTEPTRIIKQESNNNQGQIKQRIIYEIATEPKVTYEHPSTHRVTYATQPHQEIFHQMVKHPNGTTTIYETSSPATKKTIIQRKKTVDPYTVQVMANNNTIILTPIGSTQQQNIQQQSQKSIVHIHRTAPMIQTTAPPVQFLTAPQTFLKKQTVIHPQMTHKPQTNYTTVIRTPVASPTQQQIITTVSSKIQRPIQKQKVIMSTSSLQQYRSYNQKPSPGHGSRKQLHPQHIIRPAPTATTTNVIHQQMMHEQKPNQIPVILPTASASYDFQTLQKEFNKQPSMPSEHVIMSAPMAINNNQIPVSPVVLGPPPGINNIYVRPKRPQQVFQPSTHSHINNMNPMNSGNLNSQLNNPPQQSQQQIISSGPPRMRQQQNLQRPPPGSVNLERSYQICQAVIQNSPNRHQLNNQLKPPPAMGHKKF